MNTSISSISPGLYSEAYYQLPGNTALQPSGVSQPPAQEAADAVASGVASLPTDLVDLSPQAQELLAGIGGDNSASVTGNGFILNSGDQRKINDILAKYKDAPFTQDTYNKIQDDLKAAGLSPDLLAAKDEARNFNPTSIILDALNGVDSNFNFSDMFNPENEQSNANQFMQKIVQQWQSISTTADAPAAINADTGGAT